MRGPAGGRLPHRLSPSLKGKSDADPGRLPGADARHRAAHTRYTILPAVNVMVHVVFSVVA